MWPGMRPATGWIAYLTSTSALLELVGELADGVLGLRDREPVAGDDDHAVGVGEQDADVLRGRRAHGATVGGRRRLPAEVCSWPNAPKKTFETVRPIARAIISVSRVPDAPTSIPLTISTFWWRTKPGRGRGDAGERVQQRDHDRHVRAADRQDEEDAERERAEDDHDQQPQLLRPEDDHEAERDERGQQRHVDDLLARIHDRPSADQLAQLREGDRAAGERDAPDQRGEDDRDRGRRSRACRAPGSSCGSPRARRARPRRRRRR